MIKNNVVLVKSKKFAVRIIKLYRFLIARQSDYVLPRQILRSGTSVGANIREAVRAQSKPDFYSKLNIALKEAEESAYWLELLREGEYLNENQFHSIYKDCQELISILVSITKTQK